MAHFFTVVTGRFVLGRMKMVERIKVSICWL